MKILVTIIVILFAFQVLAIDGTCATNPIMAKIEEFLEKQKENFKDSDKFEAIQEAIIGFKLGDGDSTWTSSLTDTECKNFDGQDSCCNDDVVKNFPVLFKAYMRRKEKEDRPKLIQIMKDISMGVGKCGGRELAKKFLKGEKMVEFTKNMQKCRKRQFKHSVRFMKNTACAVCLAGADIATSFQDLGTDNPKLTVKSAELEEFDTEANESLKCFSRLNEPFVKYVKNFLQNELPDTKKCESLATKIIERLEKGEGTPETPAKDECKNIKFLEEGCSKKNQAAENEFKDFQGGEGDKDGGKGDGVKGNEKKREGGKLRFLQEDGSDFVESDDSGAYGIYAEDENLNDAFFDDVILAELDNEDLVDLDDIPTEAEDDDDSSSVLKLSVAVVLALIALLV